MRHATRNALFAALLAGLALQARADAILDWTAKANELVAEAKLGTPPAIRLMAIVHTAAYRAAAEASGSTTGTSVDAAIAAANRAVLAKLLPAQQASTEAAFRAALASIPDGPARQAGLAAGEEAAQAVLAARADDGAGVAAAYRPHAVPGVYVPTATPAAPQWPRRKPWLMDSASQFRPGPPPALGSEAWARAFNEVKELGGKQSARRGAAQTEIARFWEYSLPQIYHGVVQSVARQPGRSTLQNARLFAAASQAMDDALIAVFEAKYHYHFWRPSTAIRNADLDGNDATPVEAAWAPLIDEPMHPEYPSGHSILAGAVATVLQAEVGNGPAPVLATSSPTARGATRQWTRFEDFTQEVSDSRVYGGMHFRFSVDAGAEMGRRIGQLAARNLLR